MTKPLFLIGCGKMGGAMLAGWVKSRFIDDGIYVVEPNEEATRTFEGIPNLTIVRHVSEIRENIVPSVVILAVKPQTMDETLPDLKRLIGRETTFLSVAAGKTLGYFEKHLSQHAQIVRAMPNTPAAVMRGITVYVPNGNVPKQQAEVCGELLSSVGESVLIDDEGLMDAVTAVSGSGPAYVFLVIEAMAKAGIMSGLPPELAMRLARATVSGSGELARLSEETADQLRINVTSPGGTTAAALNVLMSDDGIQPIFDEAIKAAAKRSKELAG